MKLRDYVRAKLSEAILVVREKGSPYSKCVRGRLVIKAKRVPYGVLLALRAHLYYWGVIDSALELFEEYCPDICMLKGRLDFTAQGTYVVLSRMDNESMDGILGNIDELCEHLDFRVPNPTSSNLQRIRKNWGDLVEDPEDGIGEESGIVRIRILLADPLRQA